MFVFLEQLNDPKHVLDLSHYGYHGKDERKVVYDRGSESWWMETHCESEDVIGFYLFKEIEPYIITEYLIDREYTVNDEELFDLLMPYIRNFNKEDKIKMGITV
jgi:hypothetical protein